MRVNTEKEIIICNSCKGKGNKTELVRDGAYDSETKLIMCKECEGSGRLIKTIILESFKNELCESK